MVGPNVISLCSLCDLCASVVVPPLTKFTTETLEH
jgi:hypothetical protein